MTTLGVRARSRNVKRFQTGHTNDGLSYEVNDGIVFRQVGGRVSLLSRAPEVQARFQFASRVSGSGGAGQVARLLRVLVEFV